MHRDVDEHCTMFDHSGKGGGMGCGLDYLFAKNQNCLMINKLVKLKTSSRICGVKQGTGTR